MANSPQFVNTPIIGYVNLETANSSRDGSGTIVGIVTGSQNGTRIDKIIVKAVNTTTSGIVRFYLSDGISGRLYDEIAISPVTPSATVQSFRGEIFPDIVLPSGVALTASTHKAEVFQVFAHGGNF